MQREARLAQISAAAKVVKEKKKAQKRVASHKPAANQQPRVQAILETELRRSTRTTKGNSHPPSEYIDSDNEQDINNHYLAPSGSNYEGSATGSDADPLQEQQKGKSKGSSTVPPYSLHPDDPATFLNLAVFLNIFLADCIEEKKLQEADKLVRTYCKDLIQVSTLTLPLHLLIEFDL